MKIKNTCNNVVCINNEILMPEDEKSIDTVITPAIEVFIKKGWIKIEEEPKVEEPKADKEDTLFGNNDVEEQPEVKTKRGRKKAEAVEEGKEEVAE